MRQYLDVPRNMHGGGLAVALLAAGCAASKSQPPAPAAAAPLTLFLVGDSTVSDKPVIPAYPERGWEQVPLLDMERRSRELLAKMGPEQSKRLYDWVEPGEFDKCPDGLKDDTHFNAFGASRMCDLAVLEIRSAVPELARRLVR